MGGEASPHNTSYKVDTAGEKEEENPPEKPAISKLAELQQRMKEEKQRVIEYLDRKKETENLEDIGKFWRKMEDKVEKKEAQTRRLENLEIERALIGWSSWWNKMELEAETENRKKKVERKKKESFSTIKLPNQVLVGWKGWWDRVEADGKREGKKPEKNNSWSRNRSNRIMEDQIITNI